MNILKKEINQNIIVILIWMIVISLFIWMFSAATTFFLDENTPALKIIQNMPEKLLKTFNIEIDVLSKPEGIFGTEGMTFMFIFFGIFSSIIASKIFAGEFDNKTIEYLLVKPVSRTKTFLSKMAATILFITILSFTFLLSEHIFFPLYVKNFSKVVMNYFFIYIFISSIFFASFSTLLSMIFRKRKLVNTISISFVFLMFFLNSVTEGVENFEFLRKISVFYYFSTIDILKELTINYSAVAAIIFISTILFISSHYIFKNNDISI
ncbi:ABC transporter permease subunit [Thermosipho globiformans]|uniref:ABC transporter permease subunit n=1 Tax=Thermosipho globiformans TaxID=380685 RepID=UPI000F8E04E2|nr:ABC transporter permease subunit [Thermosipho globiformans]